MFKVMAFGNWMPKRAVLQIAHTTLHKYGETRIVHFSKRVLFFFICLSSL